LLHGTMLGLGLAPQGLGLFVIQSKRHSHR
jgi:hypothetical protein